MNRETSLSRWLDAHSDRNAGLNILPKGLTLSDVSGDGDYKLLMTDLNLEPGQRCRLKMYRGTVLCADQPLPDIPCAIVCFYGDEIGEPRLPTIAVACGSDVLLFKNNKPFFKFTVPTLPVMPLEIDVWRKFGEEINVNIDESVELLRSIPFCDLSPRSQHLLSMPEDQRGEFIGRYMGSVPTKTSPITCMATLNRSSLEERAAACPVVATEAGQIYILDPQAFTILQEVNVSNNKVIPSIISCTGMLEVEFRCVIVTRESYVCLLRRGWLEGKTLFQLTTIIIDMVIVPGDNFIVLGTSDQMLMCYTKRGNKLWSTKLVSPPTCLCLIHLKHISTALVAVALKGGSIQLFQSRHPVDYLMAPDTASAMTFGHLGQEEHALIIITLNGTISFKILKRTASFNTKTQDAVSPASQSQPLPIPKKTKLFLEQTIRERQNAQDIHQCFQQDLVILRLTAARALVQLLNTSEDSAIGNNKEEVKLSAQVLGLGPIFTLILTLENMNTEKALYWVYLVLHCNPEFYTISKNVTNIPLLGPRLSYKIETKVTDNQNFQSNESGEDFQQNVANINSSAPLRVFLLRHGQPKPILAATIAMPPTDPWAFSI